MNSNYTDLLKRAHKRAHDANDFHEIEHGEEMNQTQFNNVFHEIFAELIITKCAIIAHKNETDNAGIGVKIFDYFGVK